MLFLFLAPDMKKSCPAEESQMLCGLGGLCVEIFRMRLCVDASMDWGI